MRGKGKKMKVLSHSFKLRPATKLTFDHWASHPYLAGIGPTSVVCGLRLADTLLEAFRFRKKRSTWCWPKGNQVKLALLRSLRLQRTKVNGKLSANNQRSRCIHHSKEMMFRNTSSEKILVRQKGNSFKFYGQTCDRWFLTSVFVLLRLLWGSLCV